MPALSLTPRPRYTSRKRPPAQLPLDDEPEGPEEEHVAGQMKKAGVHEDVRHPLERVQAVAQDQRPVLVACRTETPE